jgi:hypothetical protein
MSLEKETDSEEEIGKTNDLQSHRLSGDPYFLEQWFPSQVPQPAASDWRVHSPLRETEDPIVCHVENGRQNSAYPHEFLHFVYCELENNKNSEHLIYLLCIQSYETQESLYTADTPFRVSSTTVFSILDRQTGHVVCVSCHLARLSASKIWKQEVAQSVSHSAKGVAVIGQLSAPFLAWLTSSSPTAFGRGSTLR